MFYKKVVSFKERHLYHANNLQFQNNGKYKDNTKDKKFMKE